MNDQEQNSPFDDKRILHIIYTTYRGATSKRSIIPTRIWFGATEWHPEEQWMLDGFDIDKNAYRSFALRDIVSFSK